MNDLVNHSRCKCGHESSPEVVSGATLRLSMGVVLQLLFYDTTSLGPCGHRLFGDRVSYLYECLHRRYSSYKEVCSLHSHLLLWLPTALQGMSLKGVSFQLSCTLDGR